MAAEDGDVEAVVNAIHKNPELLDVGNKEFGWTALHRAAHFGYVDVVKTLLKQGADPSPIDHRGMTPLHDAAMSDVGSIPVLRLLIRAGADFERRNNYWMTPLMVAVQYSNLAAFRFLHALGARTNLKDRQRLDPLGMAYYQLQGIQDQRKYATQIRRLRAIIDVLQS